MIILAAQLAVDNKSQLNFHGYELRYFKKFMYILMWLFFIQVEYISKWYANDECNVYAWSGNLYCIERVEMIRLADPLFLNWDHHRERESERAWSYCLTKGLLSGGVRWPGRVLELIRLLKKGMPSLSPPALTSNAIR